MVDHVPGRRQRKALHIEHPHAVFSVVPVQRMARNHANAQARGHRLLDRLVAAQLEAHIGAELLLPEMLVRRHARARTRFAQDEAAGLQVLERQAALLAQRVVHGGNHLDRVGQDHLVVQVHARGRRGHDVEVIQAALQPADHAVAIQDLDRHVNGRVLAAETADQFGHEVLGRAHHRHAQLAARQALDGIDPLLERLPRQGNAARRGGQLPAHIGQVDLFANHLVQRQAHRLGDFLELHRRGGLRHMQGPGGPAHAAGVGQRLKQAQLPEGDVHRFLPMHGD